MIFLDPPKNGSTPRISWGSAFLRLCGSPGCGPIMIGLAWHDAGVFNGVDGCPNAAMRLAGGGEYSFGANAGLPQVQGIPGR